jgi:EmrB/QacA subfamily drug resistance transporter
VKDPRTERRIALTVAALTAFLAPFMFSSVNVALKAIGAEFDLDEVSKGWVNAAYSLSAAIFLLPFGRAGDLYGRKRIFIIGISIYTAASLACAMAQDGAMFIVCRLIQGAGSAMVFGTGMAIVTAVFPPGERGRALGYNVAAVYLGLSAGPILGGLMTDYLGWRSIFWVNVPLGAASGVLAAWGLKEDPDSARGGKFDYAGSVLVGLSLALIQFSARRLGLTGGLLLAGGAVCLAGFIFWEMRSDSPIMDVRLFRRNRVFAFSNLAAFLNYCAPAGSVFFLSIYLEHVRDLSALRAGLVLAASPIVMTLISPAVGGLSDRVQSRVLSSIGMAITAAALAALAFIGVDTPLPWIAAALALMGLGLGLFSSPNTNAVMGSVDRPLMGIASATLGTMRLTGQMASMALAMYVVHAWVGEVRLDGRPDLFQPFVDGMRFAFIAFAALCGVGVFASMARGNTGASAALPAGGGDAR